LGTAFKPEMGREKGNSSDENGPDEVQNEITHRVAPSVGFPVLRGCSVVKVREDWKPKIDHGQRLGRLFKATTLMPLRM
jgi:hypothetical protein